MAFLGTKAERQTAGAPLERKAFSNNSKEYFFAGIPCSKPLFLHRGCLSNNTGFTWTFFDRCFFWLQRKALSNSKDFIKRFLDTGPLFYKGMPSAATAKASRRNSLSLVAKEGLQQPESFLQ